MHVPQTSRPAEAVLSDTGVGLSLLHAPRRLYLGQQILDQSQKRDGVLRTLLAMPMPFRWKCCRGQLGRRRKLPTELGSSCPSQVVRLDPYFSFPLSRTNILEPIHRSLSDNIRSIRGVWALHHPRNQKNIAVSSRSPRPKSPAGRPSAHFPVSTSP